MSAPRRRLSLAGLAAVVAAVHLLVLHWWADAAMAGWGAGSQPALTRLDAAFVRTLVAAAPAPPAATASARAGRAASAKPRPPEPAASSAADDGTQTREETSEADGAVPAAGAAPTEAEAAASAAMALALVDSVSSSADSAAAGSTSAAASAPAAVSASASAAASAPASAGAAAPTALAAAAPASSAAPAFEWPPSTRLRYRLTGNYRGEVHGNAQVQWVRQGDRYQVHLDVSVGPSFAPFMSRRMTSDGVIGPDGLRPLRYDEETSMAFRASRRVAMQFGPQAVVLGTGREVAPLPGVQDTASQFVQMTWWFNMDPSRLQPGQVVQMPLALPRRQEMWLYDVIGPDRLETPIGIVDAVHVRPRRAAVRGGDLVAEIWFAPTLQYLPVRIRIRQDDETWVDLLVATAPLQAER